MIDQWGIPLLIERNVLNQDEIQNVLTRLLSRTDKPAVQKWIKSNLRNYLISDHEEVEQVTNAEPNSPAWLRAALSRGDEVVKVEVSRAFMDKLLHAIDYLNSDEVDFDLSRLAVADALDQADEWTHQITKKKAGQESEKLAASGEEEIKKYPDGFKWMKLTSDAALDREGTLMGHCVGSYCKQVKAGGTVIYSLRDPKNEPHATIEVKLGKIEQIKGKQNKGVVEKYHSYVQDFVNTMGIPLGDGGRGDLSKAGLLEINGKLMTLPEFQNSKNLKVGGNLDLRYTPITSLPAGLEVNGHLYLSSTPITSLPAGLEVDGNLDLSRTQITSLPADLKVGGNLDLSYTKITSLPDGLKVGGDLYLSGTQITSLPDGLKVDGILDLSYTQITSLPAGLKVSWTLNLYGTPITSLPDGMKVDGNLYLNGTPITSLPDDLQVGGNLDLRRTPITSLPDGLEVKSNIYINNTPLYDEILLSELGIMGSPKIPDHLKKKIRL